MYQQGNFTLTEGLKDYNVTFSTQFPITAPSLILTDIFNSDEEDPQDFLEGSVINRTTTGFSFSLITAPDNDSYVLSWLASDGLGTAPVTSSGLPVTDLPVFPSGTSLPNNTRFPVVIPSGGSKSVTVRWQDIKSLMAASHQHLVEDISDSGPIGRSLVQANSQSSARSIIDAAQTAHTHPSTDITDSTNLSRSIIQAEEAAVIRSLIDVSPVAHTHTATQISDSTLIGRTVLTATDTATAQAVLNVPDLIHTHTVANIADKSVIGGGLMQATNEANARSLISAANVIGWENTSSLNTTRSLLNTDFGSKFLVSSDITYTLPLNVNSLGRICFYVPTDGNLTIDPVVGVSVKDSAGNNITSLADLPKGIYILESLGINTFCLTGYLSPFQRGLSTSTDKDEFISALDLTISDIPGIESDILSVLTASNQKELNAAVNTNEVVVVTTSNLSDAFSGNPAGIFFATALTALNINTIGTIEDTQSFIIKNDGDENLIVTPNGVVNINGSQESVCIPPQDYLQFIKYGASNLTCNYSFLPVNDNQFSAYVAPHGNNASGVIGDITKPFSSVSFALTKLSPNTKRSVIVLAGQYSGNQIACELNYSSSTHITFLPGAYISLTNGTNLFDQTQGSLFIKGGNFIISDAGGRFAYLTNSGVIEFNADVDSIKVLSSTSGLPVLETYQLTSALSSYKNILKAETIECAPVLLVKAISGDCTVKVRNLITGNNAVMMTESRVNLHISGGIYRCANRIVDITSSGATILNLHLDNATITQGNVGSYTTDSFLLAPTSSTSTIRVNGTSSFIEGVFNDSGTRVTVGKAETGALIISNVNLTGSLVIGDGNLTLNSVFISVLPDTSTYSIDAGSAKDVYIYGRVCSNVNKSGMVTVIGGTFDHNPAFII